MASQKGRKLLQKGDSHRENGDFNQAKKKYKKASEHCPEEAKERMEELPLFKPSSKNKGPSQFFPASKANLFKTKLSSQNSSSTGPFFPTSASSSQATQATAITSQVTTALPSTPPAPPPTLQTASGPPQGTLASPASSTSGISSGSQSPQATLRPPQSTLVPLLSSTSGSLIFAESDAPTTSDLVASFNNADAITKVTICKEIQEVIKEFDTKSFSFESVQELVVLATIPDRSIFQGIISRMLNALQDSPLLPTVILQGLAVMLNSRPKEIDLKNKQGVFLDILSPLSERLKLLRLEGNDGQLFPLLRALASLFDAMLHGEVFGLDQKGIHDPLDEFLKKLLDSSLDQTVIFLAQYAKQALAYIGNDESLGKSIYRRISLTFGLIDDLKGVVTILDVGKIESAHKKFLEICDFSVKNAWYQGLVYVDFVISLQDWPRFEKFVLESKLRTDVNFLQGICLRLEQIAATNSREDVREGAMKMLRHFNEISDKLVKTVASNVLERLEAYSTNQSPTSSALVPPILGFVCPQDDLPPVWDPIWHAVPKSILLQAVRSREQRYKIVNTLPKLVNNLEVTVMSALQHANAKIQDLESITSQMVRSTPGISNPDQVCTAIQAYYKPHLSIKRISGGELGLESCYFNLLIVGASGQRKLDKAKLKAQADYSEPLSSFGLMVTDDTETNVHVEDLFKNRKLHGGDEGVPRKILIQGRAGIGKTTLCKKLVHTWQSQLWKDHFDAVLWIPLRQLRFFQARNIEDLLREKYFPHQPPKKKGELVAGVMDLVQKDRVLFILEGLDEIVIHAQYENALPLDMFLRYLLDQKYVIITSRPSGVDMSLLPPLDLELETIGFNSQNVDDYLAKVLQPDDVEAVKKFIRQTSQMQDLIKIPVQLDAVCYSWDSLPSGEDVTMTTLYQTLVRKLWCKDAIELELTNNGNQLTRQQVNGLRRYQIDSLVYDSNFSEYLEYLAYKGMRGNIQIEFNEVSLQDAMEDIDKEHKEMGKDHLSFHLISKLKKTSFLHTADADLDPRNDGSMHSWHFLHLTFQEFFAASWIARNLQLSNIKGKFQEAEAFIQHYKYQPRYEIVLFMIAGILEKEALKNFFTLLQNPPLPPSATAESTRLHRLMRGCLREARPQLKKMPELLAMLETEPMDTT
ncbi:hypothetical protein BGX27_009714 [Mortierella sp. AM989]|nr:hypothetical protein BGX27_009714 [Mortierella sp. AM989]